MSGTTIFGVRDAEVAVPRQTGSALLKREVPVCGTHKENICVIKNFLNCLCEYYQTHLVGGHVKYSALKFIGIFGDGKSLIVEETAVLFCLFAEILRRLHSMQNISDHYSSLQCDKKAISELSQINAAVIMTCKYPEKKLRL